MRKYDDPDCPDRRPQDYAVEQARIKERKLLGEWLDKMEHFTYIRQEDVEALKQGRFPKGG